MDFESELTEILELAGSTEDVLSEMHAGDVKAINREPYLRLKQEARDMLLQQVQTAGAIMRSRRCSIPLSVLCERLTEDTPTDAPRLQAHIILDRDEMLAAIALSMERQRQQLNATIGILKRF